MSDGAPALAAGAVAARDARAVTAGGVPVVACRDLRKTYRSGPLDVPVLLGIDLDVAIGERVAIVGAEGRPLRPMLDQERHGA
jgi:ABC-type transport system involved in cytochrome bd biosynthesis fused ATPase/permease subunit